MTPKVKSRGKAVWTTFLAGFLGCILMIFYPVFVGFNITDLGMTDMSVSSTTTTSANTEDDSEEWYPIERESPEKFLVNTTTGTHFKGGGERWIKSSDKFYDCSKDVKAKYAPTNTDKTSKYYKSQEGEDKFVYRHIFHNAPNRRHYFIELGALDGVTFSNSYFFEYELGWAGLLIEGETTNYHKLEDARGKSRSKQVTTAHLAICKERQFITITGVGPMAAANENGSPGGTRVTTVPCLPISDVNQMVNLPQVDFYSIDVEGAELDVIQSHDFRAVPVHAMLIEMRPADENIAYSNAKIRRALYARGFCRYDNSVGHNNELWVNSTWTEPVF